MIDKEFEDMVKLYEDVKRTHGCGKGKCATCYECGHRRDLTRLLMMRVDWLGKQRKKYMRLAERAGYGLVTAGALVVTASILLLP